MYAINEVVRLAKKPDDNPRKKLCALITLDIKNASNNELCKLILTELDRRDVKRDVRE